MFGWLKNLISGYFARIRIGRKPQRGPSPSRECREKVVAVPMHRTKGRMPSLTWKPCHPSTVRRFKAEMTCSEGHGMVLRGHSVSADGRVSPSVVCRHPGCRFHDFVRLQDWTFGSVP